MNEETTKRYVRNQKLAVMAIQAVLDLLKKEERPNLKYFKEIKDICVRQINSETRADRIKE